jgi:protein subunit release factor B
MDARIRDTIIDTLGDRISPTDIDALTRTVASLITQERRRCANLCRERAMLWRNTLASQTQEARARANEAQYLADLLET